MVYSRQPVESDTMPQMVPSAGFTPPCDYSAFAADSFDLSLLPGGDSDLPLSPSTQLYTQSPPPPPSYEKPKIYTSFYPNSPGENLELGPDFQKLLASPPTTDNNKKDTLEVPTQNFYPDSPVGSSYCSTPEHQVYQISPYPSSPESFNLYPNSPTDPSAYTQTDLFQSFGTIYQNSQFIKKENQTSNTNTTDEVFSNYQIKEEHFLSPCSVNSPNSCSTYSNHSSPVNPNILDEVFLDSNFLDKQIKQESTVDFGELLQNLNSLKDILESNDFKKVEEDKPKIQDHQLLRQVLKDTSFQKKYNLKPFDFDVGTGFVGQIKMEEPENSDTELINNCNDELDREKIEPVLSLAIEQMRKDVSNTCNVLGISQDPTQWSPENVKAWLQWTGQQFSLAAIQTDLFEMPGTELTALTEEEFISRAPQSGSILHAQLEIWKAACMEDDFNMQWTQSNQSSNTSSVDVSDDDDEESTPVQTTSSTKPRASGGSHIHLWQFLKELLAAPQIHGSCIRWLDRGKGVFKIEDSVRVAKLWGKRKNRPAMNYDKLSRSIRQYYKKGIMKKTERSQRLVYQFCHPYCL